MSLFETMKSLSGEPGGRFDGVAIGIVTNNQDPDGLGRVKVRFPWRDSTDESHWARFITGMAGNEMGIYFLPEVGDEVLVAFEHGDIQHPFVLGSLWNGKEKPPASNEDGNNITRKIRSRSGHEIVFNDDAINKKEKLELRTKSGHVVRLDDSSGNEKIEIVDKSGTNRIVIDSINNNLDVHCGMKMSIKASVIEIQADTNVTLKAGGTLTIEGSLVKIN